MEFIPLLSFGLSKGAPFIAMIGIMAALGAMLGTAIAASREAKYLAEGAQFTHPVEALTKIYGGTAVIFGVSGCLAELTNIPAVRFAGIADEEVDNSTGAASALYCRVKRKGVFAMVCSGLTAADAGCDLWWADNQTVTKTPTNIYAGKLARFTTATEALVDIGPATAFPVPDYDDDDLFLVPVAAETAITAGQVVCSNLTGYATSSALTTAGFKVEGYAVAAADNSAGADGAINVLVRRGGPKELTLTSVAVGDIGKPCWLSSASAVTLTPGNVYAGTIVKMSGTNLAIVDLTEGCNFPRTPGRVFALSWQCATPGTTPGTTVQSKLEFPRKTRLLRLYMECTTAPGSTDTLVGTITDGTTSNALTITGSDTAAEDEAVNDVLLANTDISVNFTRTGSAAAGAILTAVFELL